MGGNADKMTSIGEAAISKDIGKRRLMVYGTVLVSLIIAFAMTRGIEWRSGAYVHTILESIATVLAFMVGLVAWVRYASRPSNLDLLLSASFLGTGALDCYHAVVTAPWLEPYFSSSSSSLIPWSWMASRLFLAIMLMLTWLGIRHQDRLGDRGIIDSKFVTMGTGLFLIFSFILFAFAPLPHAYFSWAWGIGRPQELLVAAIFLIALIGFLQDGHWRTETVSHWVVVCLLVNFIGELLFMSSSHQIFDIEFDLAHYLKKLSYISVLIGLLLNMLTLYRRADLTEQLEGVMSEKERDAQKLEAALRQAQAANHAKSAFVANMSHEIRTPLNAVLGLSALALKRNTDPQINEMLQKISASGSHLLNIINDILDFSKIESGKLGLDNKPFNIKDVVDKIILQFLFLAEKNKSTIKLEYDRSIPDLVIGDSIRVGQCLINYLSNAIKFTRNGTITVRVSHKMSDETAMVLFEVQDTGVGISNEAQARLFSNFEQADNSTSREFGGTGLGLAIVRRLAILMGGNAGCQSMLGVGSTFWFNAAFDTKDVSKIKSQPIDIENIEHILQSSFAHAKILLVEDNQINQEIVLGMLEDIGLTAQIAVNGLEAVNMLERAEFDLILMDMQMPVMDGLTATRTIREIPGRETVPIVAMTANAFAEDKEKCLDAGMNDHLGKPVMPDEFYATLLRWLDAPGKSFP